MIFNPSRKIALPFEMGHKLFVGPTGTGKTNLVLLLILSMIDSGCWITAAFPHEQPGLDLIAELYARYGKAIFNRLLVIDLRDMTKVVMTQFIHSSSNPDPLQRLHENDIFSAPLLDSMRRRRPDIKSWDERPTLYDGAQLAIRLYQNKDRWYPEPWLYDAFLKRHPKQTFVASHCTNVDDRNELLSFNFLPPREQESTSKAIRRLLKGTLAIPAILARTSKPPVHDKKAFLNRGGITVILGGASDQAASVAIGSDFAETMFLAKQGLERPGVYVVDEALNHKLLGEYESTILSTIRWKGVSVWYVVQSFDFPSEEIKNNVLQNTDHYWFRQGTYDMAMEAAKDMLGALDEYKVHHTITKQVHAGFDTIHRVTKGISKHPEHGDIESEHEQVSMVPLYKELKEDVHQAPDHQLVWFAQSMQELQWECCVREKNRAPYKLSIPLLPDSWAFEGLKERKAAECLTLLKERPEYQTPELTNPEPRTTKSPTTAMRGSNGHSGGGRKPPKTS